MLAIRLSFPYDRLEMYFRKVKDACNRVVVYQHDATRVHVHALIVGCTVSTDTLKNWIRKEVGQVAKSDWSFVTAQNEDFITYMSKGTLAPVFIYGYNDEVIESFKQKWVQREAKPKGLVQYRLRLENPTEQKKRQSDMVQEIQLRYRALEDKEASALITLIRQVVVVENKTLLGRYKLRDYYDTVMLLEEPKTWNRQMELFCSVKL